MAEPTESVAHRVAWGVLVGSALLATGYGFGRYSRPDEVKTHTESAAQIVTIQQDTKSTLDLVASLKTEIATLKASSYKDRTVYVYPNGTKIAHTVTASKTDQSAVTRASTVGSLSQTDAKSSIVSDTRQMSKTTEVSTHRPDWLLGAMGGYSLQSKHFVYGASVDRRVLGPIFLGAWGLSSGEGGLRLSLEF